MRRARAAPDRAGRRVRRSGDRPGTGDRPAGASGADPARRRRRVACCSRTTGCCRSIRRRCGRLALIGPNAATARIMGGGSAQLNPHYSVSPLDRHQRRRSATTVIGHEVGCTNERLRPLLRERVAVEFFAGPEPSGAVVHRAESAEGELIWLGAIAPGGRSGALRGAAHLELHARKRAACISSGW